MRFAVRGMLVMKIDQAAAGLMRIVPQGAVAGSLVATETVTAIGIETETEIELVERLLAVRKQQMQQKGQGLPPSQRVFRASL